MKIGVLGTGDVGKALANGFLATGHQVIMGSRSATNESALEWAKEGGASNPNGGTPPPPPNQGTSASTAQVTVTAVGTK